MVTKKKRNAKGGVSFGAATDGAAMPAAPKPTIWEDLVHPNI